MSARHRDIDVAAAMPEKAFLEHVPAAFARQHKLLAVRSEGDRLDVLVAESTPAFAYDAVGRRLRRPLHRVVVPERPLVEAIDAAYSEHGPQLQAVLGDLDEKAILAEVERMGPSPDLLNGDSHAPVIRLVNLILLEAMRQKASDVHIQPAAERVSVRMRIDGVLYDTFDVPKGAQDELVSRLKVMGRMDIAEKRLPQDGRASVSLGTREIDLRLASLPTSFGERVVIRMLDKSARPYELQSLGFDSDDLVIFRDLVRQEHGLVLVTGPTGSGKSTTLYAALLEMDSRERNVLTLEDPIEYQLSGVSQTQVNVKKGLTFATGLRNLLRQDPDVIMIGEVRDSETARLAIQAALTGHLVLSTLHTNDAASSVTRLLDLGVEPYLVASSLVGVLAQRLVRKVCSQCAVTANIEPGEWDQLGMSPDSASPGCAVRGRGCPDCRDVGYQGRVGLYELLSVSEPTRELIVARASATALRDEAISRGMKTLREDGLVKVRAGITTIDEVLRVTVRSGA